MKRLNFLAKFILVASLISAGFAGAQDAATTASSSGSSPGVQLMVNPGLAFTSGGDLTGLGTGWGGTATLLIKTVGNLYVGLETGVMHWGYTDTVTTATLNSIPVLATAIYRFDVGCASFHPYAGIGIGPSINVLASNVTTTETDVWFEGVVRPGVQYDLSQGIALTAEPKFGVLKNSFLFAPNVGLAFSF